MGTNSRLDALQAAILRVKLRHLDRWSEGRARNAALYNGLFEGSRVVRPHHDPRTRHIYNQYVIRVPKRDELRKFLTRAARSATRSTIPCRSICRSASPPSATRRATCPTRKRPRRETLALPIYPELTEEQIRYVAAAVREFVDS